MFKARSKRASGAATDLLTAEDELVTTLLGEVVFCDDTLGTIVVLIGAIFVFLGNPVVQVVLVYNE